MIRGRTIALRPIRESDLDTLLEFENDHQRRGPWVLHRLASRPILEKEFRETGFLGDDSAKLVIVDREDRLLGSIGFFKPAHYMDALELGYQIFDPAERGRGVTTEAVRLLVDWLFGAKKVSRLQLGIVPENASSRRVAEKSGFQYEGLLRSAAYLDGRSWDLEIWGLLRREWEERRSPGM